jgi:hypothetical protein
MAAKIRAILGKQLGPAGIYLRKYKVAPRLGTQFVRRRLLARVRSALHRQPALKANGQS